MLLSSFFSSFRSKPPQKDGKPLLTLKERFAALGNLPKLFSLIWQTSKWMTVANLMLRIVRAAVPVVTLYIGKLIINEIVHLIGAEGTRDFSRLWLYVGAEFVVILLADTFGRVTALIDSLLGDQFSNKTSLRLMAQAARLDLYHFEDSTFYDKLERARQQTVGRTALMSQTLSQVQDVISMAFLAVGLIAFNPWLIVLLFVALVPAFLGEAHFNAKTYSFMRKWTPERRELDMLRYTGASDETAKEVKIFGLSNFLADRYKKLSDEFYKTNRSIAMRRATWGTVLMMVGTVGYYSAYVLIIIRTVTGNITLGDLTFLAGSFSRLQSLMQAVLLRFTQMAEGALYLNDLFDFFALTPRVQSHKNPRSLPRPIRRGFTFENVGFIYPNSDRWANRHLSFTLQAGEKLALVGENGAGKTTLVKLLARFYDPTEGRILLDGYDLREYDLNDLRKEIGIIFQDFVHYQMTAADNIAIGRIEAREDRSRIEESAHRSLADSVIENLPNKYDQILGKRFKDGVELSYGEWQKVALARAYMRDAQLLILDEPTASLDARAEHEVFQRFSELTLGKMAVLISHRFSTVRMADRIVVLDKGEILEIGTHEELLAYNGHYAELFNLQAQGYR
ncbi:MAG: ABC transporter ATP-binding protein [Ignavibacteriae bacterium]|nr:ABC transporter ATP-binding protein [Ignavibacteria bacterium]MBI3364805.1 ABC transporter ATP-binding protein [Ignavibacteriota bacterium]